MLKKRLVTCILLQDGLVVQSMGFSNYQVVSRPKNAIEFFNNWDIDEIIFLDIDATKEKRGPPLEVISTASKKCFVPLTVGGGIHSLENIRSALKAGADKVCINSEALKNPGFITEASDKFGSQCIVVSIDVKKKEDGGYEVFGDGGKRATGLSPIEFAKKVEELGAGEIFLNSIDRDGSKTGFDVELIKQVVDSVNIPVVACGGVGAMKDFAEGIKEGHASAVAAANIFQYTEHSTILAKAALKKAGVDIRLVTEANYLEDRRV